MSSKNNNIPKKFKDLKRSFVKNIALNNDHSFKSFPENLSFHGKEKDEEVVLVVRAHWIVYLPQMLVTLLVLALPWVIAALTNSVFKNIPIFIALLITSFLIALSIVVSAILRWYYNVSIITDQRVIDLDFPNIMSHTMSEAQLEKIEDVTHKQIGLLGSFFDVGSVYIQTAGTAQNIEFTNIPRPRDVQDILIDMLESKQKGEI
jgi:hypothetical protein